MVIGIVWNSHLKMRKTILGTTVFFIWFLVSFLPIKEYQVAKYKAFFKPGEFAESEGYIYVRIKELIADAGWLGNSSFIELPNIFTDFVFVGLTYKLGYLFSIFFIIILSLLIVRMFFVLKKVKDPFGKLLIIGAGIVLIIQIVFNVAMSFRLLPYISISLPFVSYGSAGMIVNSFMIGIILAVYRRKDILSVQANSL